MDELLTIATKDFVLFSEQGRSVTRLYQSAESDILLVCWEPGQTSSVHDHGVSESIVLVLEGCITVADGQKRTIEVGPGELVVTPPERVHQMMNKSANRAVTLHLYAPPLKPSRPLSQPFRDCNATLGMGSVRSES
jgi:cysteine dioxygenase